MYTNCDTVSNKFEELEIAVKIENRSAIILTEEAPKNARYKLQKSKLELEGYQLFINDLTKKCNRGVAFYVKKCISASQIHMRSIASDTVWVEIMVESNKKMVLGGVYRSRNNTVENNNVLWTTIKKVTERYKNKLLIVGDFNCKDIEWENGTTNIDQEGNPNNCLLKTCRDCYLEQIVDQNTRARGEITPSLLDLILCYDSAEIENSNYLSPLGKSDHCMLLFDYITLCEKISYKVEKKYYEKANYEALKKLLSEVDWKLTLQHKDVQAQWDTFDDIIKHYVKEYVPSCMVKKNRDSKYKELFPEYIRQKIKKKHNIWKRFMETRVQKTYLRVL